MNERYLAMTNVHNRIMIEEGTEPEKLREELKKRLKKPSIDFNQQFPIRVFKVEELNE